MASKFNFEYCFTLLRENDETVEREARNILTKMCDNIIKSPNDAKYRKVRIGNAIVEKKLMPAIGAIECLFAAGFIENDDGFLLPLDSSLAGVKELKQLLASPPPTKAPNPTQTPTQTPKPTPTQTPKPTPTQTPKPTPTQTPTQTPKPTPTQTPTQTPKPTTTTATITSPTTIASPPKLPVMQKEPQPSTSQTKHKVARMGFFEEIIAHFKLMMRYEDPELQAKVKRLVPIAKLEMAATEKLRRFQKEIKLNNSSNSEKESRTLEDEYTMQDWVLMELLHWFKHEFFEWMNTPKCYLCSSDSTYHGKKVASNQLMYRIEIYRCNVCGNDIEFPRYSDPEPLLTTRMGRCGEWANVFTLICRTFGYDARYICDKTDHVWTEVWSISSNKWVHVDACEEAMDTPLLYEKGWGKKLTYVIAYSKDEVLDVTWRYTCDQAAVLKRRNLCSETSLTGLIAKLNDQRLNSPSYSEARKNYLIRRRLKELVDMLPAPPGKKKPADELGNDKEYKGRTSGALAWRLARGETMNHCSQSHKWLIPDNCQAFTLKYFILNDKYETIEHMENASNKNIKEGWQSGVEHFNNVFCKKEADWKQVYLASTPDSEEGILRWTFETQAENVSVIHLVKLHAICATFEKGAVRWEIKGFFAETNETRTIVVSDCSNFETAELDGASRISISATLNGGNNWQHAQLFRRSLTPDDEHSMLVQINLKPV